MQEEKDPKSAVNVEDSTESKDPKSDATSKDTLEDVRGNESAGGGEGGGSKTPSPDGQFDDPRSSEETGPM